jgi:hypothetical protein
MEIELSVDYDIIHSESVSMTGSVYSKRRTGGFNIAQCFEFPIFFDDVPSRKLSHLSFSEIRQIDKLADTDMLVNQGEFRDPDFHNFDDLDSLGKEGWNFGGLANRKVEDSAPPEFLPEVPPNPDPSSEQEKGDTIKNAVGCRCGMSKCLKLHCRCFSNLDYCMKNCKCKSCFNTLEHKDLRDFVICRTKDINRQAFKAKVTALPAEIDGKVNTCGCVCKTGCRKNYCECYKNNLGCSSICKCKGCENTTLDLTAYQLKRIKKTTHRKKKKIMITNVITEAGSELTRLSDGAEQGSDSHVQIQVINKNGNQIDRFQKKISF